jgi:hypothetical protein
VWQVGCAAQPAVAADLVLAYARSQAAERQGRWADRGDLGKLHRASEPFVNFVSALIVLATGACTSTVAGQRAICGQTAGSRFVAGAVFDAGGLPLGDVPIAVELRSSNPSWLWRTHTNQQGEFRIDGLPSQMFDVHVHDKTVKAASKPADLRNGSQDDIVFIIERPPPYLCDLRAQVRARIGIGAIDCGHAASSSDHSANDLCVGDGMRNDRSFYALYELVGIDSHIATGIAHTQHGEVILLEYDGDPKGGGSDRRPVIYAYRCETASLVPSVGREHGVLPVECQKKISLGRTCP